LFVCKFVHSFIHTFIIYLFVIVYKSLPVVVKVR